MHSTAAPRAQRLNCLTHLWLLCGPSVAWQRTLQQQLRVMGQQTAAYCPWVLQQGYRPRPRPLTPTRHGVEAGSGAPVVYL